MSGKSIPVPPGLDDVIRQRFACRDRKVNWIAARFGLTRRQVLTRAINIGACGARIPQSPWEPEELEILRKNAHLSPKTIQRKLLAAGFLKRSETGIAKKRSQMADRDDALTDANLLTTKEVAAGFGVSMGTVRRWVAQGRLKHEPCDPNRRDILLFKTSELARFVWDHTYHAPVNESNKMWVLDLLRSHPK